MGGAVRRHTLFLRRRRHGIVVKHRRTKGLRDHPVLAVNSRRL